MGSSSDRPGGDARYPSAGRTRASRQGSVPASPRLSAKLEQPATGVRMIRRSRQIDQLRQTEAPLIVLTAPPGFGKTTLLGQWAQEDERPFSWISLDDGDNDPAVLLMYLMRVLSGAAAFASDVLAGPIDDGEFLTAVT